MFEGKISRILLWFLLGHLVVWTVVPAIIQPNLPLDCIEMAIWGHEWQLGYYKHPPLPAWIAKAFSYLSDNSEWPIYLASQLCTVVTMWSVWRVSRVLFPPALAALAVVSLELSYYYTLTTPEFNNNIVSRCCWAVTISSLFFGIATRHPRHWMIAGLGLGLGMLSKYDTVLLAFAILVFAGATKEGRSCWKTSGPWLLLLVALGVFLPHFVWIAANDFPTFRYFLERSGGARTWFDHLQHPAKFFGAQLLAIGPSIVSCWWWTRPTAKTFGNANLESETSIPSPTFELRDQPWVRNYLLIVTLVPCAFVVLFSFLTGARVLTMWGAPMWTFAPLAFLVVVKARELSWKEQQLWPAFIAVSLSFVAVFAGTRLASPHLSGHGSRVNFPGERLAQELDLVWSRDHAGQPPIIAGPWWTAGNVAFYLPGQSRVYVDLDPTKSLWMNDEAFIRQGGMIVWEAGEDTEFFTAQVKARFPNARIQLPVSMNWDSSGSIEALTFHMAILDGVELIPDMKIGTSESFKSAFLGTTEIAPVSHMTELMTAGWAQFDPEKELPPVEPLTREPATPGPGDEWLRNVQTLFETPMREPVIKTLSLETAAPR
ncbi:MAG: hypothetical protein C0478_08055 [Planctomyces sp.]|nr:hypothetical protein [Planctomyces sp.]